MVDDKVNYLELARKTLKKSQPSLQLAIAVNFAGYHPEPIARSDMLDRLGILLKLFCNPA